ncbi:Stealth CR1 domain-containing protein [Dorea formicigenerans]|uniref:Capsular biosynthesis protein n=1 Tax=Dorea formicigenerans TaxID=39486 RepID=A0A413W8J6_9FIRM|nr:Stealth CR1 domain-containing protein [Dorea formicigenerans]RHB42483.1 hypothetical protein DW885_00160 [Dorea formicigenerans]
MTGKIDFVVPWVDGGDMEWLEEKKKYTVNKGADNSVNRYRDWDNLQYWFRGIEKFAPWVNRIHFITWGHLPKWLNVNHPKLNIVRHEDYIPKRYLPVFSANPIELNIHRIEGLEEQFLYLNDDTFLIQKVNPEDFFKNEKPNSMIAACPYICQNDVFAKLIANDLGVLNKNFNIRQVLKRDWKKWLSPKNGKRALMTLMMLPYPGFTGFVNTHLPNSYLKSTFETVWKKENKILEETSANRFRSPLDVNQHLMKYWQIAEGKYNPVNEEKIGHYYQIGRDDEKLIKDINQKKYKMICLNDADMSVDFEREKEFIKNMFEKILPEKSMFEI